MSRLSVLHALSGESSEVRTMLTDENLLIRLAVPGFQNIAAETQLLLQLATLHDRRPWVARAVESIFGSLDPQSNYQPTDDEWSAIQIALPLLGDLVLSMDSDLRSAAIGAIQKIVTLSGRTSAPENIPYEVLKKSITLSKVNKHQVSLITEICLLGDYHTRRHGAACDIVIKCLKHSDPQYRLAAAQQCTLAAQSQSRPYLPWQIAKELLHASNDSVVSTRLAAIEAFTGWKRYQFSSVPRAAELLEDDDREVRIAALNVLKGMSFACRAKKAIRNALRHHPELASYAK